LWLGSPGLGETMRSGKYFPVLVPDYHKFPGGAETGWDVPPIHNLHLLTDSVQMRSRWDAAKAVLRPKTYGCMAINCPESMEECLCQPGQGDVQ